jgi:hypothetical protein
VVESKPALRAGLRSPVPPDFARHQRLFFLSLLSRSGSRYDCRSLGYPGFPVESDFISEVHAPLLSEIVYVALGKNSEVGKSGSAWDDRGDGGSREWDQFLP